MTSTSAAAGELGGGCGVTIPWVGLGTSFYPEDLPPVRPRY
jgi:hypothetical protein